MRTSKHFRWAAACGWLLSCAALTAGEGAPPPPDPVLVQVAKITELLQQTGANELDTGIAQIKGMLRSNQRNGVEGRNGLRNNWLRMLLSAGRFEAVLDLAERAILSAPDDVNAESFLPYRVQAFLEAGKKTEALSAARQYFNFASMKRTSNALYLVNECLRAVHPDDPEVLKRFYREQVDGAAPPKTGAAGGAQTLMAGITFEPGQYESAAKRAGGDDFKSLQARGNLLLLAGRTKQARETFEFAYSVAEGKDLVAASENLARCMKAEDGSIGRANAWVASIRPEYQPARIVQPTYLVDVRPEAVPTGKAAQAAQNEARK